MARKAILQKSVVAADLNWTPGKPQKHSQTHRKGQSQTCPTMHSVVKDSSHPDSQALVVDNEPTPDTYNLFTATNGAKPLMVKVQVNKQEIPMEIDTGLPYQLLVRKHLICFLVDWI